MSHSSSHLSWAALILALVLWGGVGAFAWQITEEESARDSRLVQVEEEGAQQASLLKLRALARETEIERAHLNEIADRDIVEVLDTIENVSHDAGILIKFGESLSAAPLESSTYLKSATLVVEAQGTFTQVTRAVALLESLSLPSSLTELHLEEMPVAANAKSKTPQWRIVARLNILTSGEL